MARFSIWMLPTKRRWRRIKAGYQDLYNDKGNWSTNQVGKGVLIGTNRSISAPVLAAWRKRDITKQEMEDLSITEAMSIYKSKYWDKIQADKIESQAIADLLADMKSSAGGNGIKQLQKALNELGYKLSVDGAFGDLSLKALNNAVGRYGEARVFNMFRSNMVTYYKAINNPYEKQLIGSLNEDYPPMKESVFSLNPALKNNIALFIILLGVLSIFLTYKAKSSEL